MQLKPGTRLQSVVDSTQVVVVKAPEGEVDLRCGGHPMVPAGSDATPSATAEPGFDEGTLIGKRYADDAIGIELLCSKAGTASLSVGADRLEVKTAKPLPSSD
jgi:hypothetical protein